MMGYLNFQIEHHLFPSMPQYKNARAAPYVRRFCDKWSATDATNATDSSNESSCDTHLKYTEYSYVTAWRLMLSNLNQVGKHYYKNGITESVKPKPKDE
jgi:hypothetical protein